MKKSPLAQALRDIGDGSDNGNKVCLGTEIHCRLCSMGDIKVLWILML
jgi:hypothetical protein